MPAIRDFRGAISSASDCGIFTKATFTTGTISEAERPGAVPVQLVDLKALIDLLGKQEICLITDAATPGQKRVYTSFFDDYLYPKATQSSFQQAFL